MPGSSSSFLEIALAAIEEDRLRRTTDNGDEIKSTSATEVDESAISASSSISSSVQPSDPPQEESTNDWRTGRPVGAHRPDGPAQAIQNFSPRHQEIIRRLVCGQTQVEIAEEMGYSQGRLSIIINSPLFQHKLKEFQKQVSDKLVDTIANVENKVRLVQPAAVDTIVNIMNKKGNDRLRRDCAKDLLEIGGTFGRKRDEDGMNDFARIIADAFKMAQGINGTQQTPPNIINVTPESNTTDDLADPSGEAAEDDELAASSK